MTRHIDEIGYHPIRLATTLGRLKRPSAHCGSVVVSNGVVDGGSLSVLYEHSLIGAGESSGKTDHISGLVLELGLRVGHIRLEFP
jgi:hypothetical protein